MTGLRTCLALVLLCQQAAAQPARGLTVKEMRSEARTALVIGNSNYDTGTLRNPRNDAAAMAEVLAGLGFTVIKKFDCDLRQMKEAVRLYGSMIQRGGVGLFYYAGHAVQVDGNNYLVPVRADITDENEVSSQVSMPTGYWLR